MNNFVKQVLNCVVTQALNYFVTQTLNYFVTQTLNCVVTQALNCVVTQALNYVDVLTFRNFVTLHFTAVYTAVSTNISKITYQLDKPFN